MGSYSGILTLRLARSMLPNVKTHIKHNIRHFSLAQRVRTACGSSSKPIFLKMQDYADNICIIDQHGTQLYKDILYSSNKLTDKIEAALCERPGERIAYLCSNDSSYVVAQMSSWMSRSIGVPLSKAHPASELQYFLENSRCKLVLCDQEHAEKILPVADKLSIQSMVLEKKDYVVSSDTDSTHSDTHWFARGTLLKSLHSQNGWWDHPALMVYTSGTTGPPKGVLHSHGSLTSMMTDQISAWGWTSNDVILHILPLHHVHGIINVLNVPLYCGAACVMMPNFDAKEVWSKLLSPVTEELQRTVNVFMAVPTVYAKLLELYSDKDRQVRHGQEEQHDHHFRYKKFIRSGCMNSIRLMVSGSSALPKAIMDQWEEMTGHRLLERYGMTETGMLLTNPLQGERVPGAVGSPMPSVEVCIAEPNVYSNTGYDALAIGDSQQTHVFTPGKADGEVEGELYVRGATMFSEYWDNPTATEETFTSDGWFKTGDIASYKDGIYHIKGRRSVDIIKSGGYKISALDIEHHLLSHPDIKEVCVVGLPDLTWGQKVAAVIVLKDNSKSLTLHQLREWAKDHMALYQMPTMLKVLDELPRSPIGKVNKKELVKQVFPKELRI